MPLKSNVGTRTFTDPLALRALAHPLRLEIFRLVGREGALTAADAARQLDISHALASHHLRQLAKYGFVEEAHATDGRARPWRVTSTSVDVAPTEPEAREAADVLQRYAVERAAHDLSAWQQRRGAEGEDWSDLPGAWSGLLYLTREEFEQALREWHAIVRPLVDKRPIGQHDQRPADALPIAYTLIAVPVARTEQGG